MNRKAQQSSSTESSSEEEGEGEEGGEEPIAMETSSSEGDIRIIDVISMEEPVESIGTFTS